MAIRAHAITKPSIKHIYKALVIHVASRVLFFSHKTARASISQKYREWWSVLCALAWGRDIACQAISLYLHSALVYRISCQNNKTFVCAFCVLNSSHRTQFHNNNKKYILMSTRFVPSSNHSQPKSIQYANLADWLWDGPRSSCKRHARESVQ